MRVLDYNDVMEEKIKRRRAIPELQYDVHGHCIHIGPISYGCRSCFAPLRGGGIQIGNKCMSSCPMCYYDPRREDVNVANYVARVLGDFTELRHSPDRPYAYSYQSSGETLIYIKELEKFAKIFKEIEDEKGIEIYHHLYTNGILANKDMLKRVKDMGVDEIRFHLSASNFSKKVYDNMYEAAKMNFIVSVEEPSWPLYKEKLFEMLPILQDIDVKHLDIVEVQVTQHNIGNIETYYSSDDTVGIYKDHYWHMYDGGLVYDIIEEVLRKGYTYSVLDCNSGVERCRQVRQHKVFDSPDMYTKGFAVYQGFDKSLNNKHSVRQ